MAISARQMLLEFCHLAKQVQIKIFIISGAGTKKSELRKSISETYSAIPLNTLSQAKFISIMAT
jgi:hypothetical protein